MTPTHSLSVMQTLESRLLFATGDLDPAFNHAALVETEFPGGSSEIVAVKTLADGGILAAGTVCVIEGNTLTDQTKLALVKYRFDGSLDPGFGIGGTIVNTPRSMNIALRLQLAPDGGFFVMGRSNSYPGPGSFTAILKFTKTGKVDMRFAKNGLLKPPGLDAFTVDPQGRILVGGSRDHAGTPASSIASDATLQRYTALGALDTSFNQTGQFVFPSKDLDEEESNIQIFRSMAVDDADRIYATAEVFSTFGGDESTDGLGYAYTRMFRFSDSGQLDAGYGGTYISGLRHIAGLLDEDSILLLGKTIARVDPAGHLDTTYGNNGVANTTKLGQRPAEQAKDRSAVNADGSIVFANVAADGALELTRINPLGQPDAGWGNSGTLTVATDSDPDAMGYLDAVDLAPDGSIVFAGQSGILTPRSAEESDPSQTPNVTIEADTRKGVVGRVLSGAGPAVQLVPRTLKASALSLYITVWIRDPEGVDESTLDDDDLKLLDAEGSTRRLRFVSSEDVNGDGAYIAARYRITGPGGSPWSSADNGIYRVRLQPKQIADQDDNRAAAQMLGAVYVKID